MTIQIDISEAVRSFLSAQAAITAIVGSRIHGPPGLPASYHGETSLWYHSDGGALSAGGPLHVVRVQIDALADQPPEAQALARVVIDNVARVGPTRVTIADGVAILARADLIEGPRYIPEPEMRWHRFVMVFRMVWGDRVLA